MGNSIKQVSIQYEIILPRGFGFNENDIKIYGFFQCVPVTLMDIETIKTLDLNDQNLKVRKDWGFKIVK